MAPTEPTPSLAEARATLAAMPVPPTPESIRGRNREELTAALDEQDLLVAGAVAEFLDAAPETKPRIVGTKRTTVREETFWKAAQHQDVPITRADHLIFAGEPDRAHSEGAGSWIEMHPGVKVYITPSGQITLGTQQRYEDEHDDTYLPTLHRIARTGPSENEWTREPGVIGLPFAIRPSWLHREWGGYENGPIPGRIASSTSASRSNNPDFAEKNLPIIRLTTKWFIMRLAAYLDDPGVKRDFWGKRL
jgi:hypothetical protein